MSEIAAQTAMRRKLAPPRPAKAPGQSALQLLLAKTMPRDADRLLGLQIVVASVEPGAAKKADIVKALAPTDLIYLMKTDRGSPGLCILSPGLLSGLIEIQMSGRVSAGDPLDRVPTRTDGIVASDIIDRWIASAKAEAAAQEATDKLPFADHYRAGTVSDARNADLVLDPGSFRTLAVTLELCGGVKTGRLFFALPERSTGGIGQDGGAADRFRGVVREAEAQLSVVLAHLPRTLDQVRRLVVGDTLEIPIEALRTVALEAAGGKVVAMARLGQSGGQKAVRIPARGEPDPSDAPGRPPPDFLGAAIPGGKVGGDMAGLLRPGTGIPDFPAPPSAEIEDFPELPELPALPDLPDFPD